MVAWIMIHAHTVLQTHNRSGFTAIIAIRQGKIIELYEHYLEHLNDFYQFILGI